jgi:hypothetical protein
MTMQTGARLAMGVGIGYILGRSRKMRVALALAAAGATGKLGSPGALLSRGKSVLAGSPEVAKLTERMRGELVDAVKAATMAAATNRIDSPSNRIQAGGSRPDAEVATKATDKVRETLGEQQATEADTDERQSGSDRDGQSKADRDEQPDADRDEQPKAEERDRGSVPTPRRGSAGPTSRDADKGANKGVDKEEPSEGEGRTPVRRRATRAAGATTRTPVRRARR